MLRKRCVQENHILQKTAIKLHVFFFNATTGFLQISVYLCSFTYRVCIELQLERAKRGSLYIEGIAR